jgi:hypothetical protein
MACASRTTTRSVLVIGRDPVCADFVAASSLPCRTQCAQRVSQEDSPSRLVLFLDRDATVAGELIDRAASLAGNRPWTCACLVIGFGVHCGDTQMAGVESVALRRLKSLAERVVVFRTGHRLTPRSRLASWLRRLAPLIALIPNNFTSCFVEGDELFEAIDRELEDDRGRKQRTFTLLGANRAWRDVVPPPRTVVGRGCLAVARAVVAILLLGPLAGWLLSMLAKRFPTLRTWNIDTLRPDSIRELLTLYNPYNFRHVKIVGYNNGVVHFGHRYSGRTVVSTIRCDRLARVRGTIGQFDGGVTIRRAMDVLAAQGKELPVLPNYSYVALGTAFFVPIHGSASEFSTIAETIESVILYDPVEDRVIAAGTSDPAFSQFVYNLSAHVLLLRLTVKVKDRSRYSVKQETVTSPPAQEVWDWFHDRAASNVEVRKAGAVAKNVTVYRYYPEAASAGLDVPRDQLGRLWDRLEENPITSWLFHTLSRKLAHHVELFLTEAEFHAFWETHASQPIAKIQLRFIRRDGFANSPFRDHDCISADLFMRKKHRRSFEAYLKETVPGVRLNPGKHSM